MSESIAKSFFLATGVGIDFELSEAVWTETGRRFRRYAQRRRQSGGDEARRLLADFVVGSHALLQADRLMTLDERRYRTDFRELQLYDLGI